MTPAVKLLLIANVAVFVAAVDRARRCIVCFGLTPELVVERFWVWQLVTYPFLHADLLHLLFNMLALWMFGVDLERRWGQQAFLRYYFVCGVGAGLCSLVAALLPFAFANDLYITPDHRRVGRDLRPAARLRPAVPGSHRSSCSSSRCRRGST